MPSSQRRPSAAPTEASRSRSTIRRKRAYLRRSLSVLRRHIRRLKTHRRGHEKGTETTDSDRSRTVPRQPGSDTESLQIVLKPPLNSILLSPSLASVDNRPWPSALVLPPTANSPPTITGPPIVTGPPAPAGTPAATSAPPTTSVQTAFIGPNVTFLKLRRPRKESSIEKELDVIDSCGQPLPWHERNPAVFAGTPFEQCSMELSPPRYRPSRHARKDSAQRQPQRQPQPQGPGTRLLPDLPDEIWSQIGTLVIDQMGPVDATRAQVSPRSLQERVRQPPITRTCRYMRMELLPYFYHHTLVLKMSASCQVFAKRWLVAIGPQNRRHLDNVFFVADRESHLLDPSTGATHRCGKVKLMVGLSKAECRTLGLMAYYSPSQFRVYARKIKWLEGVPPYGT